MSSSKRIIARSIPFDLQAEYEPAGDQGNAINSLVDGLKQGKKDQVLLGVTGSGKTFTMANIIKNLQRPAIIMAHNKTLAAQLYGEMKEFFPNNAVEYFVSYYDYYQPEAYIPKTNTYIEKDAAINEQIEFLRHSATKSLIERRDVIVVSSVSSIYGLGSPVFYKEMTVILKQGENYGREKLIKDLIDLQYKRNDMNFSRGKFRVKGDIIDIFPSYSEDYGLRVEFFGDEIESLSEIEALTGSKIDNTDYITIYANTHYATPPSIFRTITQQILADLAVSLQRFRDEGKLLEASLLDKRTRQDVESMLTTGSCKGIENYSRYLDNRKPGEPPSTLFHYLPQDALVFIDESHATIPQIRAMYAGDRSRKTTLVEHGFRLPSALDNRPLKFEEWDSIRPFTVYVSATPGPWELDQSRGEVTEQIIRPTGLLDPECEVRPALNQIDDIISESKNIIANGMRIMIITLTKKMAEDLNIYLGELGVKCMYIHSDIATLERIKILKSLRHGEIDIIIGINLLREGIDIPECGLVAIMDADKEGFLRSETSLIQIIGRAARNSASKVLLYADKITVAMEKALKETARRRVIQQEYNVKNNILPKTISKPISTTFDELFAKKDQAKKEDDTTIADIVKDEDDLDEMIAATKKQMLKAAENLEFEEATRLRDLLHKLNEERIKM